LSGVEILATAFANLLTDRALRPSEALVAAAIVLAFGFVIGASVYFLPALVAVPLAIAMSGLYGVGVQWAFNEAVLWLPLATPVL
jgi:adenylate cyclase